MAFNHFYSMYQDEQRRRFIIPVGMTPEQIEVHVMELTNHTRITSTSGATTKEEVSDINIPAFISFDKFKKYLEK